MKIHYICRDNPAALPVVPEHRPVRAISEFLKNFRKLMRRTHIPVIAIPVIARSEATTQSILGLPRYGLLRFARNDEWAV
jgi:hypothetical protein